MGQMRFTAVDRSRMPPGAAERAYLADWDSAPYASRNYWDGDDLVIERPENDSAVLYIPYAAPRQGPLLLSTSTLVERGRPYLLPLELARGTIYRLRGQMERFREAGLSPPARPLADLEEAILLLARAATGQHDLDSAATLAEQALHKGLEAMAEAGRAVAEYGLRLRAERERPLAAMLACRIDFGELPEPAETALAQAFNGAAAPLDWRMLEPQPGEYDWSRLDRRLEWARRRNMKTCVGPLMNLVESELPSWLLDDPDPAVLNTHLRRLVAEAVRRCRGKIHLWHLARWTSGALGGVREDRHFRLMIDALHVLRRLDGETPMFISFDQPWGEYLAAGRWELAPYFLADQLSRAEVGVTALGLEINLGPYPGATAPRDLLQFHALLERWSLLGLPLVVLLSIRDCHGAARGNGVQARPPLGPQQADPLEIQNQWTEQLLPVLFAHDAVQGVIWNQTSDGSPPTQPGGGLLDAAQRPKPVLETLRAFRREYLA